MLLNNSMQPPPEFPKLELVGNFKLVEKADNRLVFTAAPYEINPQHRVFAFDGKLWEVGLATANIYSHHVQHKYVALRLHGFILRGGVMPCEGMKFLTNSLPTFVEMSFWKAGVEVKAVFLRGDNFESKEPIMEGEDRIYFFDHWKKNSTPNPS